MVDIQSVTAKIRRGKKRKNKKTTGEKYHVRICYGDADIILYMPSVL